MSVSEDKYVCEHMHNYVHVCNGHIIYVTVHLMYYINPL